MWDVGRAEVGQEDGDQSVSDPSEDFFCKGSWCTLVTPLCLDANFSSVILFSAFTCPLNVHACPCFLIAALHFKIKI